MMNHVLFQMNAATAPTTAEVTPQRQIGNYFGLLKNMGRLGLALVWEKRSGAKHFAGIINDPAACKVYDDIVACVMSPETTDSEFFAPEEIDAMAHTLSNPKLTLDRTLQFLKTIIASRLERDSLEQDGDTHQPSIGWLGAISARDDLHTNP